MKHKHTIGCTPLEIIECELPQKYKMELNPEDMLMLLQALYWYWNDETTDAEDSERALSLRSSILETLGIEEV